MNRLPPWFDRIDRVIASTLRRHGVRVMRYALAIVFILFGILKPLGISPAEGLVLRTVEWVPLVPPRVMLHLIGWWEVAIGLCFLWRPLIRVGVALLAMQMVGTFMPLVIVPDQCYRRASALGGRFTMWTLTTEAQYILKNLLIIAGAMVVGGTARRGGRGTPQRL